MRRFFALIAALLLPTAVLAETASTPAAPVASQVRLLLFTGSWDATSTEVLDRTLAERRLQNFLTEKSISVSRHDVLASTDLTRAYHIRVLPTLLLLGPDGTELDRWTGPQKSSDLLRDLKDALAGKNSLTKRRAKLDADDLKDHFELACNLTDDGRLALGLEEYLHVLQQLDDRAARKKMPPLTGPQDYKIHRELGQLARIFPPAGDALRQRRAALAASVLEKPDRRGYVAYDVAYIDRQLGDSNATLAFFQQLPSDSKARNRIKPDVFKIFIARKAYHDAAGLFSAPELIELRGQHIEPPATLSIATRTLSPLRAGEILKSFRLHLLTEWCTYFEAYAAQEDRENATVLARFILDHDKDRAATGLITTASHRALGVRSDEFLRSLSINGLPSAEPASLAAELPSELQTPDDDADPETVQLDPFVVSEAASGALPFTARWRVPRLSHRLNPTLELQQIHPRAAALLKPGERVLAIDGKSIAGLSRAELQRLSSSGNAGDDVILIVQGSGLDHAIYREVTVKRVAPQKQLTPAKR